MSFDKWSHVTTTTTIKKTSITQQNSLILSIYSKPSPEHLTPDNHWFVLHYYSFVFARMPYKWNNIVCSLTLFKCERSGASPFKIMCKLTPPIELHVGHLWTPGFLKTLLEVLRVITIFLIIPRFYLFSLFLSTVYSAFF